MQLSEYLKTYFHNTTTVFWKEFSVYFNSPIGTIFASFFLFLTSFLFFFGLGDGSFWDFKSASMEAYFLWVPILYVIFIPALSMRLWSEEERSGTLEILFSLPLRDSELVFGKFLAAWSFLGFVLLFTFPIPGTIFYLGDLDLGTVAAGYLGIFLLGGADLALGSFISSLTKDQISSYLLGLVLCLSFFLLGYRPFLQFLGTSPGTAISFLSLSKHFESFRLGILDGREIFFYLSFILVSLYANILILRSKR
ncbi:ABC transporter permease [Leptospira santarosai]|uniref:Gliding motility ABC transporter n=2 Tax=Leptospira santarosai TaxID=28183 RepID=K8Y8L6_9LEPT|nr:ABC transporter permease [Leptospira santarosai]EMO56805.1 ABC-2 family transporter protein [Leptospira santarosai str. CBC1416]EKR91402.1 ABC-2 family transporter protein [Leptospira santarosai str. CBC379]EKS07959.1 ABC-2 family transporter protein [Leptospira santarosai str. JET]EKT86912.1 gliding motility ABC transporter [Leptospira santarosai serovar Shermani str. LT 821]EMJ47503.1 ABC-2 family transporter protein [Leptospira santarosai str. HAI1349]